ncbi:hypothetical protein BASA81_001198 [Batrachochytrium salamandrivorans]|nr:hypothetical protein BASA81_001198 [Batrachochytrium salamandrivorans]
MDITFEEVAFVIQDARFQQAIFDSDVPKPDKKFPQPPRGFSPATFTKEHDIGLHTVLFEPIGRFFLEQCAEKDTHEMEMLRFTQTMADLRKMDPAGYVQVADIEAVCLRFGVQLEELNEEDDRAVEEQIRLLQASSAVVAGIEEFPTTATDRDAVSVELSEAASPSKTSRTLLSGSGNVQLITTPTLTRSLIRMSAREEEEYSQQRHSNIMSFQSEAPQRFDDRIDLTSAQPMSTFYNYQLRNGTGGSQANPAAQAQAYSAAVAAATMRKLALEGKQQTPQCIRANHQVTTTIETKLKPAYDRLVENRQLFALYCSIKWYSMQPVTEKDVRFHRILGMGAFGTVNGCIITSVGSMLAIKTMNKKRIKAKKAKSQVTAERDALEALAAHSSPYCLRLRYSYETKDAYHFILPIAIAGDLKYHLKEGAFTFARASPFSTKHTGFKTRNDGTRKADIKFPEKFEDSAKSLIVALLSRRVVDRVRGMNEVLNDQRWLYWKDFDIAQVRRNEMPPPWLPEKGHIYAASQGEIQENEDPKETRKVKILPEDTIPFSPFVDVDGHQTDIVKVLEILKANQKLTLEDATTAQPKACTVS